MARRRRRLPSRIRASLRGLLAFLFSNVGVIVLVMGYTIAGAFIFQAIEGASEMERINNMARERDSTANYLWQNITLVLNLFNETELKYRIGKELQVYQRKIVMAARHGWDGGRVARQWSFSSAFLYSLTVITTIGYGNLSPRTMWGKLATIFYALLGMPLFLLYLSNVGELLARWFKCIYALVCLCRGCPGFTRRRVIRVRTQVPEISEAESIERPEAWRSYSGSSENAYYNNHRHEFHPSSRHQHNYYQRPGRGGYGYPTYERSYSTPNPTKSRDHYAPREPNLWERPPYLGPRRPDPHNMQPVYASRYDPRAQVRMDPRVHRGYSEPAYRKDSLASSDFTYITFDAQTITVPISVCVAIMVGYLIFGSMIFGMWEKWDQLDGTYFCFISLTSIGFGDFVPGERVMTQKIETSFIVCSLYLMLGMALVAMCFNLMQEQVRHYFAGIKRALKRICRCKR